MLLKKILTVAGSDSGGCAGIQADIKTISAFGQFATTVLTSVTSQNTLGVTYIEGLSPKSIETQIDAVLSDIGADAIKTGMLFDVDIISVIHERFAYYKPEKLVIDPVMVSATGSKLLKDDAIKVIVKSLFPQALIITPNRHEAEVLTGIKITNHEKLKDACKKLFDTGCKNVLLKGGHLEHNDGAAKDTLYDGKDFIVYSADMISTKNIHGTGCTYSAAIATALAMGNSVDKAVEIAKAYISKAIYYGQYLSIGKGSGPVDHLWEQHEQK